MRNNGDQARNQNSRKYARIVRFLPFFLPHQYILDKWYFELLFSRDTEENNRGTVSKNEIKGENVDAENRGPDCGGQWKNFAS